ncbi:MAG: hypothetical protein NC489_29005 [Ruminococcus flavefaciens]|nr:hypothetical protein [Ruminococcus flavefaciens]
MIEILNSAVNVTNKKSDYKMQELKKCPICGKEIDLEKNMYIPDRDWKPTLYDPDSGGDPISIHCDCGLEFCTGTHDWDEFAEAWNTRQ